MRNYLICLKINTLIILSVFGLLGNISAQIKNTDIRARAQQLYIKVETISINPFYNIPEKIRGKLVQNIDISNDISVKKFFKESSAIFYINEQTDKFVTKSLKTDYVGMKHLKLQQFYKGIPVYGSEIVLHSNALNELIEISGRFIPNLNMDTIPVISKERAIIIALDDLGPAKYRWKNNEQEKIIKKVYRDEGKTWKPMPILMIAPQNGDFNKGKYKLVWKMTIAVDGVNIGNYEYFIDAQTGKIINKFNSMAHVDGTGISNYNGKVSIITKDLLTSYEMIDEQRAISTYSANNGDNLPGTLQTDSDNLWDQNHSAVDVHWAMEKVNDFYVSVFNRNSFDDNGAGTINTVDYIFNYGTDPNNASWNGAQFMYGPGDDNSFSSLTTLDVVGHEFNHAIDDFEANLIYQNESGALDEALADIMGTVIEFYVTPSKANWLIGEECYTPNTYGDALRNMQDPKQEGDPDTYHGINWDYNGEVHINSGVLNHAFYLICQGGIGTNDNGTNFIVSGIGIEKGRPISYRAHTIYLISSSDYASAREAFLSSASDLYGSSSAEYKTVSDAFGAVGLGVKYVAKNSFDAGIIKINGYMANSGDNFFATDGSTQILEAVEQYHDPYQRVWNTSGVTSSISKWQKKLPNGNQYDVGNDISYNFNTTDADNNATFTAGLKKLLSFKVETVMLNGGNGGSFKVNYDSTFPSPYQTNIVEQNSVTLEALDEMVNVNGKNVDYHFISWSDGSTSNPKTFTPDGNVNNLTANMKGHLASDTSLATGYNNGRRMVWDAQNKLYMVYEDGHQIWFTQSLDTGATWIPEKRINQSYPQSHPSIAVNYNGVTPSVHVVYETLVLKLSGGFDHAITYQHKGNNGWEPPEYLDGYINTQWIGNQGERPVIVSGSGDVLYIAWRDVNSGKIKTIYKSPTNGWSPIKELSGTNGYPVIGRTATGTRKTKLIWSDGNDIKYTECEFNPYGHYWMTYSVNNLTGMFGYAHDAKPTMAIDANGIAHVAWEAEHNGYGSKEVLYHQYDVNNGGNLVGSLASLASTYMHNEMGDASISYQSGISAPVSVFYDNLGSITRIHGSGAQYGWSSKGYGSGKYPNTTVNHTGGTIWTKYNNAPFLIPTDYNTSTGGFQKSTGNNIGSQIPLLVKQRFDYNFESADTLEQPFISLILQNTTVNGKNITFNNQLESTNIALSGSDNIKMNWRILVNNVDASDIDPQTLLFKVYFIEGKNKTLLKRLSVEDILTFNGGVIHNHSLNFFHNALGGQSGRLKIEFSRNKPVIINMLMHEKENTPIFAKGNITPPAKIIPVRYSLQANYPNPFNPSTHIKFGIPQDTHVLLEIYNTAGQRIATLMNRNVSAGTYETTFDASGLASGIYIYRLQAGSFTRVRRMLLIK